MENVLLLKLGNIIKKRRTEMNLSQEDLAGIAEIDRSYLSEIENGKKNISIVKFIELSKALELKPEILIKNILE